MENYLWMFNKSPGPVAPCQSRAAARSGACRLEPACARSVLGEGPALGMRATQVAAPCPRQGHSAGFLVQEPQKRGLAGHRRSLGPWLHVALPPTRNLSPVHRPGAQTLRGDPEG